MQQNYLEELNRKGVLMLPVGMVRKVADQKSQHLEVFLKRGKIVLIDECDFELLLKYKWNANLGTNGGWAVLANDKRKIIRLHNKVMNALWVDHKNGNGLDNRRCNLRKCTPAENARNSKKKCNGSLNYKGIHLGRYNRYKVTITKNYKRIYIGVYKTQEEAARAYDKAAIKHFGEFARLNFPLTK